MDGRQRRDSAFMAALQFLLIQLIDGDASLEALIGLTALPSQGEFGIIL
jgi:hypothetical protein